jgi:hypothetical protein
MKRLLIAAVIATSVPASAECYLRLTSDITPSQIWGVPTDVQRLVAPDVKVARCVLRYRLNVNGEWRSIEGAAVAANEEQACARAADLKTASVLGEVVREKVRAGQEMICSDLPDIQVRAVRVGETIWESETDVHRVPAERAYFVYKGTKCRMFSERNNRNGNLYTYQGVICRENSTPNSRWRVVDKY